MQAPKATAASLAQELSAALALIPEAVGRLKCSQASLPNSSSPFVFFHQRKCGGTSLRELLANSSKLAGLPYSIPCHNLPCNDAHLRDIPWAHRDRSVFGSHYSWQGVKNMLYFKANKNNFSDSPRHGHFSCVTNIRNPLSRVESCWQWRMPGLLASNDTAVWAAQLRKGRSKFAEGCNNEPMRVFWSGGGAEDRVNALTSADPDAPMVLRETLSHLSHCVIFSHERCEESLQLLGYFHPWLHVDCSTRLQQNTQKRGRFTEQQLQVVREQNELEIMVHGYAERLFDAQLEMISDVLHVMDVADPRGQTITWRIFARDLADPAAAVQKFCALYWTAALETCALAVMRNLAQRFPFLHNPQTVP